MPAVNHTFTGIYCFEAKTDCIGFVFLVRLFSFLYAPQLSSQHLKNLDHMVQCMK